MRRLPKWYLETTVSDLPFDNPNQRSRLLADLSAIENEHRALEKERAAWVASFEARRGDLLGRIAFIADSVSHDAELADEMQKLEQMENLGRKGTEEPLRKILERMLNPERAAGRATISKYLRALERLRDLSISPQNFARHIVTAGGLNQLLRRPFAARRGSDKSSVRVDLLCPLKAVDDLRSVDRGAEVSMIIRVWHWSDGTVMLTLLDIGPEWDFGD